MPSQQEVVTAVARLRQQGMTEQVIVNRLVLCGWPEQAILAAISQYAKTERDTARSSVRRARAFSLSTAAFSIATVFLLVGGAWAYANYERPISYSLSLPAEASTSSSTPLTYGAWPALSNPAFYSTVTKQFLEQKASFITADLSKMELSVYKDGALALTIPIVAKGKVGSWWETPVGIYEIQSREENHLSSFSNVYQPWSLAFQGNYFIHGIPYYPDGKEVDTSYSGGCIRLKTSDAQKVYDLASVGMPVIVYKTAEGSDTFTYQPKSPQLPATSTLIVDIKNGTILAAQNEGARVPIASLTKLMTALVTVEYLNLERKIVVPQSALVETTVPRLHAGQTVSVHDLLILMLTESSNQAAEVLASALGRDYFVKLMNDKAKAIGLFDTEFSDPSGLSEGNISTARDLFLLLQYIYENRHFVFDITNGSLEKSSEGKTVFGSLQDFNIISKLKDEFVGGKVGNTDEAKQTYVGVFMLPVQSGQDRPVGVVVLGSSHAKDDVVTLLNFAHKLYVDGVN